MTSGQIERIGGHVSVLTHFDNWIIRTLFSPYLYIFCRWRIHPNLLTVLALGLSAAIPFFHLSRRTGAVIAAILLRQILDCLDGEVARRCRKTSNLGAWLDNIADGFFFWGLILIVVLVFIRSHFAIIVLSCLIFGALFAIHVVVCGGRSIMDHALKDYDTPSMYRRCYALVVNDSLLFVAAIALFYGIATR